MAVKSDRELVYERIRAYVQRLRENDLDVWRVYVFGSYAKGTYDADSDIDLAVFLDQEDVDGFDEGVLLTRLRRGIEPRIEPHAFAKTDLEHDDPMVREILRTGERIA
jgi:predicted nucleotidyltransferase